MKLVFVTKILPGALCVSWKKPALSTSFITAGCGSLIRCASPWYADGCGFDPHVRQNSFVKIGNELISVAILSLPLIQEGQLSVTDKRMCTKYWYTAQEACPGSVDRLIALAENDLKSVEGP